MIVRKDYGEEYIMKTPNEMVSKDHLLRKVKEKVDFEFIYEIVKPYYSDIGRPGIDPLVLFKMLFVKYLYGIKSTRKLVEEIEYNIAYRWFCGISFSETVPHFDTISKNYIRRYKDTDVYEQIFNGILSQVENNWLLNTKTIYQDSTHIKANANKKKVEEIMVKEEKKAFEEELLNDINNIRKNDGKPLYTPKEKKAKKTKKSTVDSECGLFHKGEHEQIMGYNEHVICDKYGYILKHKTKPSNIHDSQVFVETMSPVVNKYENIENIAVDSGYKNGSICKWIIDRKIQPLMPYKNTNRRSSEEKNKPKEERKFNKKMFQYHYKKDVYICPNMKLLTYRSVDSNGYKIYKCTKKECDRCQFKSKCCPKTNARQITHSIYLEYLNYTEHLRKEQEYYDEYKTRSQTIERDFGDLKEKHGMRYTYYRGLKKVEDENHLRFACFNMKKMTIHLCRMEQKDQKSNREHISNYYLSISSFLSKIILIFKKALFQKCLLSSV